MINQSFSATFTYLLLGVLEMFSPLWILNRLGHNRQHCEYVVLGVSMIRLILIS